MTECCSWTLKCLNALELRCNGKLQFIIYLSEISWVSKPVKNQHNQRSTHLHSCTCAGEGGPTGSSVSALILPCSLSRSLRRVTSCRRLPSSCCRAWPDASSSTFCSISALPWASTTVILCLRSWLIFISRFNCCWSWKKCHLCPIKLPQYEHYVHIKHFWSTVISSDV